MSHSKSLLITSGSERICYYHLCHSPLLLSLLAVYLWVIHACHQVTGWQLRSSTSIYMQTFTLKCLLNHYVYSGECISLFFLFFAEPGKNTGMEMKNCSHRSLINHFVQLYSLRFKNFLTYFLQHSLVFFFSFGVKQIIFLCHENKKIIHPSCSHLLLHIYYY